MHTFIQILFPWKKLCVAMATLLDTFQRKKKNKCVNEKHFMSSTPAPEVRCVRPIKKKRVVFSLNETLVHGIKMSATVPRPFRFNSRKNETSAFSFPSKWYLTFEQIISSPFSSLSCRFFLLISNLNRIVRRGLIGVDSIQPPEGRQLDSTCHHPPED